MTAYTLQKKQKEKTINHLLGALTPAEQAGQLMALGFNGAVVDPETEIFISNQ